ncbi:MAG: DUF3971 domain-containing protein, partial [Pseudomonadota bacterium]
IIETILAALSDNQDAPSRLSVLKSFEIEDAVLIIDDRVTGFSWVLPRTNIAVSRNAKGLNADANIVLPKTGQISNESAAELKVNALLNLASGRSDFDITLENFDLAILGEKIPDLEVLARQQVPLNANLKLSMSKELEVLEGTLTALSEEGALNVVELSPEPVEYKDAGLLARYSGENSTLEIGRIQVSLDDLTAEANALLNIEDKSITGPLRVDIESVQQTTIEKFWPAILNDDNSKEWIVDKLSEGTFSNLYAQGDLEALDGDEGWSADVKGLMAGFEFEGMSIDYRAPLKPVTNAKGKGTFNLDSETLRVDVESANLLDLNITEANVELINIIEAGAGQADINIQMNGPAKDVLTYIKDEPIGAQTRIDIPNVRGNTDMQVNVSLPTKENILVEDVSVTVLGKLTEANLPNVIQGLALSGGPFDVSVKDNRLNIKGQGQLAGRALALEYDEYLISSGKPYVTKVKAALTVDENLRQAFGIDLSTFLEGSGYADITYTEYQNGRAEADVVANLEQARLFLDPFDYEKPAGVVGSARLKAILRNDELLEILDLTGSAPSFTMETSKLNFRQRGQETELSSGNVSRFTIGETVAGLEFEIDPSGLAKISLSGPFLDLRPFLNNDASGDEPYEAPPLQISVAVDTMRTSDEETVQYGKIYADIDGQGKFNQLEMDAIAGAGDIYLRFKPDGSGRRTFRLEADDAGATLKAFDLYDNVIGGKLVIYGQPIQGIFDRNLVGAAEMTNFKVVNAPGLARLLSAMSLPGLMQNLNGQGLNFTKMEANFDWLYRPNGSLLVLKDGTTSGNSLGLTFDGTFDNAAQMVDVSGTIIPLSGVNKMIGDIPLVGDILTGGTGALIAATYTMRGPSEDPRTSVNPLSVLTPGILRRILFEQN